VQLKPGNQDHHSPDDNERKEQLACLMGHAAGKIQHPAANIH